jgi:hypothetical protein
VPPLLCAPTLLHTGAPINARVEGELKLAFNHTWHSAAEEGGCCAPNKQSVRERWGVRAVSLGDRSNTGFFGGQRRCLVLPFSYAAALRSRSACEALSLVGFFWRAQDHSHMWGGRLPPPSPSSSN